MAIGFSQTFNLERKTLATLTRIFNNKSVYSRSELMSRLGVGDNKVEAMVTWMSKLYLRDNKKRRLSLLGKVLANCDPYFDNIFTKWLLHYQLAKNPDAEVWHYMTNKFLPTIKEFTFEEALRSLKSMGIGQNSPKHLNSDLRIYLRALVENDALGDINILLKVDKNTYRKSLPKGVHPLFIAFVIYDQRKENYPGVQTININELLTADGNVGKVCLLNREKLEEFLYQLQEMGYLVVSKFADLDQIALKFEGEPLDILEKYYKGK